MVEAEAAIRILDDERLLVACDRLFDVRFEHRVDVFAAFVFRPEVARDRFFFDLFHETRFAVGEDRERERDDFRTRLRTFGNGRASVGRGECGFGKRREALRADACDFGGEHVARGESFVDVVDVVGVPR